MVRRARIACLGVLIAGVVGAWATVTFAAPALVNRAGASSVAKEIDLRGGDLKLRTVLSAAGVSRSAKGNAVLGCTHGLAPRRPWAQANSAALATDNDATVIVSRTLIVASSITAVRDVRAIATNRAQTCSAATFREFLAASAPHASVTVTARRIPSAFRSGGRR
jgi:hypothetical protein